MHSRRNFIGKVASGIAGSLAATTVLGANERIRVGIIGAGDRGMQILREAAQCPGVDIAGLCDIYSKRLETAGKEFPNAREILRSPAHAGRRNHRRRPDRHAAASARGALRRRDGRG